MCIEFVKNEQQPKSPRTPRVAALTADNLLNIVPQTPAAKKLQENLSDFDGVVSALNDVHSIVQDFKLDKPWNSSKGYKHFNKKQRAKI